MSNRMEVTLSRRGFLRAGLTGAAGLVVARDVSGGEGKTPGAKAREPVVYTVTGTIPAADMGFTLPHEHVMVDWNGGDGKSRERYDPAEVVAVMKPYLMEIRELGVRTFVDCTPPYLGRDVLVLRELALATGLNIITNTGLYEKKYAPPFAFEASQEEITDMFVREIVEGIEGTGIRACFIKIGVSNEGPVTPNDEKIVTAACRAHHETGATINSHTFQGVSALRQIEILEREKVDPAAFTYVHACFEPDVSYTIEAAKRGVWIEFDSIRPDRADFHVERIFTMLDKGFEDQLLLSQDRGWYRIGEEKGGTINDYSYLPRDFLPLLKTKGVTNDLIDKLTITNPARSYALRV